MGKHIKRKSQRVHRKIGSKIKVGGVPSKREDKAHPNSYNVCATKHQLEGNALSEMDYTAKPLDMEDVIIETPVPP